MIYLVTRQQILFPSEIYEVISVEKSIEILQSLSIIGLDTETTGFDPYTKELVSVQMGNKDFQVFIDTTTVDILKYRVLFESDEKLFILHNAKFDLKFLYHKRILPNKLYDTFLGEKILWQGYPPGYRGMSLQAITSDYLNFYLDKSIRGKIGLTDDVIKYGCEDVKYLEEIMNIQQKSLQEKDLERALRIENEFVKVLAYIEYCGIKLDESKWLKKMNSDQKQLDEAKEALIDWLLTKSKEDAFFAKYFYIELQGDLFEGFQTDPICTVNWNSSSQLIPIFERLGLDLYTKDKRTGNIKKSVDAKILDMQKNVTSLVPLYLRYSSAFKVVTTYGQNVLNQINPVTKRIHTNFNQLMDTGRLSCGGKDRENRTEYLNLQNLPSDATTRACFVAEEGNVLIDCDYTAQEDLVFTELSQEPKLIEFYNDTTRKRDGHSYVAKICFPDDLGNIPEEEVKDKRPDLRTLAKKAKFSIHYGGNGTTIARNLGLPEEQGLSIEKSYLSGFTEINNYFKRVKKDMWDKGYILISSLTGHKMFIPDWKDLKETESQFNQEFWARYREEKLNNPGSYIVQDVRNFFKKKSGYERNALNAPIQGTSAIITKIAGIKYFNHLREKNRLFHVLIVNDVHDEYLIECPDSLKKEESEKLSQCMEDAGSIFVKSVSLKAVPEIADHWVH